jgi:hypothetical protein
MQNNSPNEKPSQPETGENRSSQNDLLINPEAGNNFICFIVGCVSIIYILFLTTIIFAALISKCPTLEPKSNKNE